MSAETRIQEVLLLFGELRNAPYAPATFATSFGAEDMVLTDLIAKHAPWMEIFTLDTGRLPEETYRLMQETLGHYRLPIQVYFPEHGTVERYVREYGPNAFYENQELRKTCCHMRKVEPLRRALRGKGAWVTGMRREQALSRQDLAVREWDAAHEIPKFNPLADWHGEEVWDYIRRFEVPYNHLHDQGYPSIGCTPCTRAVAPGQDIRAGRWWWENPDTRECGLHVVDGKLIRTRPATPQKTAGQI
ncbi:phosphoadenylyl-sulfate reductase [Acidithiobacillus ferrivorans]|uniref:Adenosine 5'-phosphosulfate reductase n=1 Tax=Acidithiobacillus ferrivorans TaxID=160808 RepID=A0A1B9BXH0_9PROT|nr:phosphoadenylyl-sulfate reductase [Acidithiobacillus ferrivorans]MBN6740421.1 phosphoadenylyl-sulfate reductase [Acidithiobacillus sp. MC6.1]OCB02408.1 phosphoadenosine phosphosulfate reductase [Acidithiobacillus ferrivorans]QQD73321.1 phosphoadenylyl-sulfate reductase [Acidithiobacillus ferrivorans]